MNSRRFMSSMGTSSPMRYQPADRPVRPGAGRAHARHRLQRSAARPNSAPSKKRILCERRHIADAVAKLVSYLSIVPHMRSSDVPPKHSAPLTRGIFSAARLPASRTAAEPVAKSRANLSKKAPLGRGRVLRDERCGISATRPNWADENVPINAGSPEMLAVLGL